MSTPTETATYAGLTFGQAIRSVFGKYSDGRGRATRSEYWYFVLFQALVSIGLAILLAVSFTLAFGATLTSGSSSSSPNTGGLILFAISAVLLGAWWIATIVPAIAVSVRRFHDAGYTGWLWFLHFVPSVGSIAVIVFMLLPSASTANNWGPAPVKR